MITVKNIRINDALSEETLCYSATVCKNGKKFAVATNAGHGGETDIRFDEPNDMSFADINELTDKVDDLVYDHYNAGLRARFNRKLERDSAKAICIGVRNSDRYTQIGWKKFSLAQVRAMPNGLAIIQKAVDEEKAKLTAGQEILNRTHLERLGVTI